MDARYTITSDDLPDTPENPRPAQVRTLVVQDVTLPTGPCAVFVEKVTRTVHFVALPEVPSDWIFMRFYKGTT